MKGFQINSLAVHFLNGDVPQERTMVSLPVRVRHSLERFITGSRIPDQTISKSVNIRPYTVEFGFLSFPCLDSTSSRCDQTTKTDALPSDIYLYVHAMCVPRWLLVAMVVVCE